MAECFLPLYLIVKLFKTWRIKSQMTKIYKRNHYEDIDEIVYKIRLCAVENPDGCGNGCKCDELKDELLRYFKPLFNKLEFTLIYPTYQNKEDFNNDLKTRLLEMIYEWDDTRNIYFTHYVHRMMDKLARKLNQNLRKLAVRKEQDFKQFNAKLMQKNDMRFDKDIEEIVANEMMDFYLSKLTVKQQNVIKGKFLDRKYVNELADKANVSPGAVSNLLKRAYDTLRDVCDEETSK